MERFLVETTTNSDAAVRTALDWAAAYCADHGCAEAAVLIAGLDQIDNFGSLLGTGGRAKAEKARAFSHAGATIRIYTDRTAPYAFAGPVVIPWAYPKLIEKAESLKPAAVCATEWVEGELDDWKRSHGPVDPATGEAAPTEPVPAATRGFVRTLTEHAGGGNVLNPMDKGRAIDGLKALKLAGPGIDPAVIRAAALDLRWQAGAADRLRDLAVKVAGGSAVRGGGKMNVTLARERVAQFEQWADRPLANT